MPPRSAAFETRGLVVASAGLAELNSRDVRFLQEAAQLGRVHVRLWADELLASLSGTRPAFPQRERLFFLKNIRYVDSVSVVDSLAGVARPVRGARPAAVVAPRGGTGNDDIRNSCIRAGIGYVEIGAARLAGFPISDGEHSFVRGNRRVVVSGCFDWLHSGHIEFFRDAASLGDLYVVVGSDRNVRWLKGEGHPLQRQEERAYMVHAVRSVHRALISTGEGWMDAEPEIASISPDLYVVNEDGDQPEKRDFCRARGLEYVVLRRRPHRGLPRRTSTDLRGF
jgi:cytidyltransferase-like protein